MPLLNQISELAERVIEEHIPHALRDEARRAVQEAKSFASFEEIRTLLFLPNNMALSTDSLSILSIYLRDVDQERRMRLLAGIVACLISLEIQKSK